MILPLRAAGPLGARPFTTSPSPPGPAPDSPASNIIPMPTALDESARRGGPSQRAVSPGPRQPAGAAQRQHACARARTPLSILYSPGRFAGPRPALRFWLNPRLIALLLVFSRAGCRTLRQSHPRPSHDIRALTPTAAAPAVAPPVGCVPLCRGSAAVEHYTR